MELVVKVFMLVILLRYSTVIHRRCKIYLYIGVTLIGSTLPLVFNVNTTSILVPVATVYEKFLLHSTEH